jgi:S-sulfosulfanyl-L-cysteine sulfohydrolase
MKRKDLLLATAFVAAMGGPTPAFAGDGDVTLIHTGDFHGHLIPRPNVRSDAVGHSTEGGLARIYTKIRELRAEDPNALLIHTGDTIQGSAEALYSEGQVMINILNYFGINAFAPGNWDFVYGSQRFIDLFGSGSTVTNWITLAANVFYSPSGLPSGRNCPDRNGARPTREYEIFSAGSVRVGVIGLTTDRGPQVVGSSVTAGLCFLRNGEDGTDANGSFGGVDAELRRQIQGLRPQVDVLVLASEMGLANNVRLATKFPELDVVLSSDMHEETADAVVIEQADGRQTLVAEEGQDGTMLGRIKLKVRGGKVVISSFKSYRIGDDTPEDPMIAALIAAARKPFVSGPDFVQQINRFGTRLLRPIDTVVGLTAKSLHRSNFAGEAMPAVIEGSSHDMLTDAFRAMAGAQIGAIRGSRYGTHVPVGVVKLEDLYHFMPIGAQIAAGTLKGQAIKNQIETAANGSLNPNLTAWTGGWLYNFSGVTMDLDPYATLIGAAPYALTNGRAFNVKVNGVDLALGTDYTYASYWYAADPCLINTIAIPGCTLVNGQPSNIVIVKDIDGTPLDGTEVVARYFESLGTVDTQLNRTTLKSKTTGLPVALPPYRFGFPEVQPLLGAQP